MSSWIDTVTRVYKENHAKNPNYKFKQAMSDAKKVYKKGSSAPMTKKMRRRRTRGTRRH